MSQMDFVDVLERADLELRKVLDTLPADHNRRYDVDRIEADLAILIDKWGEEGDKP